jgi:hypothetical protein
VGSVNHTYSASAVVCGEPREYITGVTVWTRRDFRDASSWTCTTTATEIQKLTRAVPSSDKSPPDGACSADSLPWTPIARAIRAALFAGRGFTVVQGFDVETCDIGALTHTYHALAAHVGTVTPQNVDGDTLRLVTDMTSAASNVEGAAKRGHRGRADMQPHSDSADAVGLLCIRRAMAGGATRVSSSAAIYNKILRTRPELLDVLCAGFHFDMTGKSDAALNSSSRTPVFRRCGEQVLCTFNKARIEAGMLNAGMPLDAVQRAAIDYMNDLAMQDEFSVRFILRPGEALFLNNHVTLHGRDAYEDYPQPDRQRLLVRVWMNMPKGSAATAAT